MNCENCGIGFELGNRASQRYCSAGCQRKAERRRYKAKKSRMKKQKRYEETGLRGDERLCKNCGVKFNIRCNGEKYCSDECRP